MSDGSVSSCLYSAVVALDGFDSKLGEGRVWKPISKRQDAFLRWRKTCGPELASLGNSAKGLCSSDADELNRFLTANGFSIQLDPFGPEDIGSVGILNLLVEWAQKGSAGTIHGEDGKDYEGVRIDAVVLDLWGGTHRAARLETKDGTRVYIMPEPNRPSDQFALMARVNAAQSAAIGASVSGDYVGVRFPMVDMRVQEDMAWLLRMSTADKAGDPWFITQALQENRLRMNEFGARAQSATALCASRGIGGPRPFVVDQPFVVWFTRPGTRPLFAAWVGYADWKNPGDLTAL